MNDFAFSDYPPSQLTRKEYLWVSHPGTILLEDFMKPLSVTTSQLAEHTGLSQTQVQSIIQKKSSVGAAAALRLSAYLGVSPEFWLNLQGRYDLLLARDADADDLKRIALHPEIEAALQTV